MNVEEAVLEVKRLLGPSAALGLIVTESKGTDDWSWIVNVDIDGERKTILREARLDLILREAEKLVVEPEPT